MSVLDFFQAGLEMKDVFSQGFDEFLVFGLMLGFASGVLLAQAAKFPVQRFFCLRKARVFRCQAYPFR